MRLSVSVVGHGHVCKHAENQVDLVHRVVHTCAEHVISPYTNHIMHEERMHTFTIHSG